MFELRWLKVNREDNHGQYSFALNWYDNRHIMVLQFREREGPEGDDWWSDWKDIPVVEDK